MRNLLQRTLKDSISCTGIGLHSGEKVNMKMRPAPEDSGIVFYRSDLPGSPGLKAILDNVSQTRLATTLNRDGVSVATVEHLLAALAGLGIDNARVELSGPEVPIMDGSSAPFVYLLKAVGLKVQTRYKRFLVVRKPVSIFEGDRATAVYPSREFSLDYSINYDNALIGNQRMTFRYSDLAFTREISRARTYGFLQEYEYLKKNGFARGGSLDNAVVIDRFRILNPDGLRFPDEMVRHKILDFIGDLSLLGLPVIGRFEAIKSGHSLHYQLMNKLMSTPEAWTVMEFSSPSLLEAQNFHIPTFDFLEAPTRQAA